ncbi:MAG: tripartite tricarboxylate transporter TctB family protein [Gammaproteobacteria bacterium]|nr:tripartite tricarboxylate transporter TctB family protein [Gammaproteobacteria bacterium]MDE0649282.1 tripartite tricarboxylate transporter TctB family protein [Gammaproteobacteria bacterium]
MSADGGRSPRTDLISGASLFVVALAYGIGAGGLAASGDADVALVPIGLAAALALLSAGIALSGWRKLRRGVSNAAGPGSALGRPWTRRAGPTRAWTVIGLTILYATVFQILGYVLATLLYTGAVAERFGARRRTILVLAPCVTLLTYLLFRVVLGARLPEGLLG